MIALSETANAINGEIPDAIGWRPYAHNGCGSTLVEVKVSRSDFLSDAKKQHRASHENGMGVYRYYMAPVGLIAVEELPHRWGLIEVTERGHVKVLAGHILAPKIRPTDEDDPWRHGVFNIAAELSMLVLAMNRVGNPQKFQNMLREANNRNSRTAAENKKLRGRINELQHEVLRLRHGDERTKALPRLVKNQSH